MDQRIKRIGGYYYINDRKVPSMTFVLGKTCPKTALNGWKKRTADWEEVSRRAALFGTMMHMRILGRMSDAPLEPPKQLYTEEWPRDIAEEMEGRDVQWNKLRIKPGRPRLVEHTVWTTGKYPVAGTLDYTGPLEICGFSTGQTIMDLKSSRRPQVSHELQIAGYAIALEREGIFVETGVIPYIRKNSSELVIIEEEELTDRKAKVTTIIRKFYDKYLDGKLEPTGGIIKTGKQRLSSTQIHPLVGCQRT